MKKSLVNNKRKNMLLISSLYLFMNLLNRKDQIKVNAHLANLIREGRNIEAQVLLQNIDACHLADNLGTTLLHVASECDNQIMTQYLLDNQLIGIDVQDYEGKTPVMLCLIEVKYEKVVRILLNFKPNLFICDNFGKCTLQLIFEMSLNRCELIKDFFNLVREQIRNDEILAHTLVRLGCPLRHAILFKKSEITKILLQQSCPINARDFHTRKTALHVCVAEIDVENIRILTESGADVNALDSNNTIPSFEDYVYNNSKEELEILQILIERGALFTEFIDSKGCFPIEWILDKCNSETFRMLLDANVDWRAKDSYQKTLLHYLLFNRKLLRESPDVIEDLRKKDFDVNATDASGNSLLLGAASRGLWQFVHMLLDRNADPNIANFLNCTPLYIASACLRCKTENGQERCMDLLLQYGADPQIVDTRDGETIFDQIMHHKRYNQLESVLGQLVIFEDRGIPIIQLIRDQINSHQRLQDEFDRCRQQLEKMKRTEIHKSITLYEAFNNNEETIAFYLRNDEFFSKLKNLSSKYSSNSYYCRLLEKHFDKPFKYETARREIIDVLCDIMKLNYNSYYIVMDKIAEYAVYETLK